MRPLLNSGTLGGPMLRWDPTDVLCCLGVAAVEEEHGISHAYTLAKDGLRLELTVFQYDGDVCLTVYRDGVVAPIIDARIVDCDAARWVNDQRGNYLEFAAGQLFGGRYDGESTIPYGVRVSINPSIAIHFFRVPA
ncbi:MAG: Ypar14, superfamily integron cassette [Myxococcota bacterium]